MDLRDKLQHIFHRADAHQIEEFAETFEKYKDRFGINTEVELNFFLAQIVEETGGSLVPKRENLNYSCNALKKLFGYYKKNHRAADRDGRCNGHKANQRNIANHAYANRIGNGGPETGDGWRFRGGGYIQLTGRGNYYATATVISLALNRVVTEHDLEAEIDSIEGALLSAMAFWAEHELGECKTIDCVTAKVNKHTPTYKERKRHYQYIASL